MTVFSWRSTSGFKIKSHADAREAAQILGESPGTSHYFSDDTNDYQISDRRILKRPQRERGNIFSPYWEIAKLPDDWETVWKMRKTLNREFFTDESL